MKSTITTLKLEKETKERLEKLREHKRETYDDIIRKIMYVLNTVRDEPLKAKAILEFIDEKRKRMFEASFEALKIKPKQTSERARREKEFKKEERATKSIPNKTQKKQGVNNGAI